MSSKTSDHLSPTKDLAIAAAQLSSSEFRNYNPEISSIECDMVDEQVIACINETEPFEKIVIYQTVSIKGVARLKTDFDVVVPFDMTLDAFILRCREFSPAIRAYRQTIRSSGKHIRPIIMLIVNDAFTTLPRNWRSHFDFKAENLDTFNDSKDFKRNAYQREDLTVTDMEIRHDPKDVDQEALDMRDQLSNSVSNKSRFRMDQFNKDAGGSVPKGNEVTNPLSPQQSDHRYNTTTDATSPSAKMPELFQPHNNTDVNNYLEERQSPNDQNIEEIPHNQLKQHLIEQSMHDLLDPNEMRNEEEQVDSQNMVANQSVSSNKYQNFSVSLESDADANYQSDSSACQSKIGHTPSVTPRQSVQKNAFSSAIPQGSGKFMWYADIEPIPDACAPLFEPNLILFMEVYRHTTGITPKLQLVHGSWSQDPNTLVSLPFERRSSTGIKKKYMFNTNSRIPLSLSFAQPKSVKTKNLNSLHLMNDRYAKGNPDHMMLPLNNVDSLMCLFNQIMQGPVYMNRTIFTCLLISLTYDDHEDEWKLLFNSMIRNEECDVELPELAQFMLFDKEMMPLQLKLSKQYANPKDIKESPCLVQLLSKDKDFAYLKDQQNENQIKNCAIVEVLYSHSSNLNTVKYYYVIRYDAKTQQYIAHSEFKPNVELKAFGEKEAYQNCIKIIKRLNHDASTNECFGYVTSINIYTVTQVPVIKRHNMETIDYAQKHQYRNQLLRYFSMFPQKDLQLAIGVMRHYGIVGMSEMIRCSSFRQLKFNGQMLVNRSEYYDDSVSHFGQTLGKEDTSSFSLLIKECHQDKRPDAAMFLGSILLRHIYKSCQVHFKKGDMVDSNGLFKELYYIIDRWMEFPYYKDDIQKILQQAIDFYYHNRFMPDNAKRVFTMVIPRSYNYQCRKAFYHQNPMKELNIATDFTKSLSHYGIRAKENIDEMRLDEVSPHLISQLLVGDYTSTHERSLLIQQPLPLEELMGDIQHQFNLPSTINKMRRSHSRNFPIANKSPIKGRNQKAHNKEPVSRMKARPPLMRHSNPGETNSNPLSIASHQDPANIKNPQTDVNAKDSATLNRRDAKAMQKAANKRYSEVEKSYLKMGENSKDKQPKEKKSVIYEKIEMKRRLASKAFNQSRVNNRDSNQSSQQQSKSQNNVCNQVIEEQISSDSHLSQSIVNPPSSNNATQNPQDFGALARNSQSFNQNSQAQNPEISQLSNKKQPSEPSVRSIHVIEDDEEEKLPLPPEASQLNERQLLDMKRFREQQERLFKLLPQFNNQKPINDNQKQQQQQPVPPLLMQTAPMQQNQQMNSSLIEKPQEKVNEKGHVQKQASNEIQQPLQNDINEKSQQQMPTNQVPNKCLNIFQNSAQLQQRALNIKAKAQSEQAISQPQVNTNVQSNPSVPKEQDSIVQKAINKVQTNLLENYKFTNEKFIDSRERLMKKFNFSSLPSIQQPLNNANDPSMQSSNEEQKNGSSHEVDDELMGEKHISSSNKQSLTQLNHNGSTITESTNSNDAVSDSAKQKQSLVQSPQKQQQRNLPLNVNNIEHSESYLGPPINEEMQNSQSKVIQQKNNGSEHKMSQEEEKQQLSQQMPQSPQHISQDLNHHYSYSQYNNHPIGSQNLGDIIEDYDPLATYSSKPRSNQVSDATYLRYLRDVQGNHQGFSQSMFDPKYNSHQQSNVPHTHSQVSINDLNQVMSQISQNPAINTDPNMMSQVQNLASQFQQQLLSPQKQMSSHHSQQLPQQMQPSPQQLPIYQSPILSQSLMNAPQQLIQLQQQQQNPPQQSIEEVQSLLNVNMANHYMLERQLSSLQQQQSQMPGAIPQYRPPKALVVAEIEHCGVFATNPNHQLRMRGLSQPSAQADPLLGKRQRDISLDSQVLGMDVLKKKEVQPPEPKRPKTQTRNFSCQVGPLITDTSDYYVGNITQLVRTMVNTLTSSHINTMFPHETLDARQRQEHIAAIDLAWGNQSKLKKLEDRFLMRPAKEPNYNPIVNSSANNANASANNPQMMMQGVNPPIQIGGNPPNHQPANVPPVNPLQLSNNQKKTQNTGQNPIANGKASKTLNLNPLSNNNVQQKQSIHQQLPMNNSPSKQQQQHVQSQAGSNVQGHHNGSHAPA